MAEEAKTAATPEAPEVKRELYALRPGKKHSIVGEGGNRRALEPGEKVHLNPAQYESFKDKFVPAGQYDAAVAQFESEQDNGDLVIEPPPPPPKPSATEGAPAKQPVTAPETDKQASIDSPAPGTASKPASDAADKK